VAWELQSALSHATLFIRVSLYLDNLESNFMGWVHFNQPLFSFLYVYICPQSPFNNVAMLFPVKVAPNRFVFSPFHFVSILSFF